LSKAGFLDPAFGTDRCTKHEKVGFEKRFEDRPVWIFKSKGDGGLKSINQFRRAYPSRVLSNVKAGNSRVAE